MDKNKDIIFNPMSDDPEIRAFTQNKCLDAMHLIKLFVNAYDKHRYDKTNTIKNFNFINSMDVFRKECNLYGFTDDK
jgi:hypothetical protein